MKWILILFALGTGLRAQEAEPEPFARAQIQDFLREAREAYATDDPEARLRAAQRFQALLDQAPEGELKTEALKLAKGMSLLKAGKPEEALQALESITSFEDPEERSRLRNLRGQAQMHIGQAAAEAREWAQAKSSMEAAVDSFTNALRDVPSADAARHNLELSRKRLEEIIKQTPPPQEQEEGEDEEDSSDPSDSSEEQDQKQEQEQSNSSEEQEQPDESDGSDEEEQNQTDPTDEEQPQPQPSPADSEPSEDLDAQQAQQILDAYLEQEKHQRSQILQQRIQSIPVEKDW
ncbi:MAG: hypothetical protein PF795_12540 [Kiritimatiellae bacterium]|nr:hypothetical protein [Kiritimatiellia bacterium]